MKTGETLAVVTREEFRPWLADRHKTKAEIWLVFYYKRTGKPTIPYNDAVEEAICYGWINSQQNRMDEERFVRRFSPRRKRSQWSRYNRERALRMLRMEKITEAGLNTLPAELLAVWEEEEP